MIKILLFILIFLTLQLVGDELIEKLQTFIFQPLIFLSFSAPFFLLFGHILIILSFLNFPL